MNIHEKINVRSFYCKKVNRAIEPYIITPEELKIWKHNEAPFRNPNGKY